MSYHQYPATWTPPNKVTRFVPQAALALGAVGAVVGGTAAAARNIRRMRAGEIDRDQVARDSLGEAAGAGLATAVAAAAIGAVGATGLLSLAGVLVVATGTKYLWDSAATAGKKPPLSSSTPTPPPREGEED
ncbi:MAG: hypothetical protein V1816_16550 [Pseudomonadota bacterium]